MIKVILLPHLWRNRRINEEKLEFREEVKMFDCYSLI